MCVSLSVCVSPIEGTYKVETADKRIWHLTIVASDENELVASLGTGRLGAALGFTYFYITYNKDTKYYVGTEKPADIGMARNRWIQFRVTEGNVEGRFYVPVRGFQNFSGPRTERYPDYFKEKKPGPIDAEGRYKGFVTCGRKKIHFELVSLTFPDKRFHGTRTLLIKDEEGKERVVSHDDFIIGNQNKQNGILYLTGQGIVDRFDNTINFVHLRGILKGNKLHGQMIHGGVGIKCDPFVLKKIE